MLKWAVNFSRQTYDNNELELPTATASSSQQRQHLNSKPSDTDTLKLKASWHGKENQYTSTPLPTLYRSLNESPSNKIDSLKDLSNIIPENLQSSPMKLPSKTNCSNILKTPEGIVNCKRLPNNYAPTLPTFDVEYSPCALIPGPLIALRGVGIPDSYFEKPRYITPFQNKNVTDPIKNFTNNIKMYSKPNKNPLKCPIYVEESTLSSTQMGDSTLERMIDSILDSNCKNRKCFKPQKPSQEQKRMSPTYTPAEDPANDLQEVWDPEKARYRQKEKKIRTGLTQKSLFNGREVCSPQLQLTQEPGQLRRQGGLRRKRNISQITANVMSSAQKLLSKASHTQTPLFHSHKLRKVVGSKLEQDEIHPHKQHLSPDSGHNSSSDFEENENDSTLEFITYDNKTLDNTKRKLNYSLQDLSQR